MSQDFFRKTLNMLTRVDESPQIGQLESEQLDELSPATLGSYIGKAAHEKGYHGFETGRAAEKRDRAGERAHTVKGEKRQRGIERAASKLAGGPVDEMSQDTLKNYRSKAERSVSDIANASYRGEPVDVRKKMKRMKGLDKVARKIQETELAVGDMVAIETAPGMQSPAKVVSLSESLITVQTKSGTEYTLSHDEVIVEADMVGLGEKSRRPTMPAGPVVEDDKPDFLDMDDDGNKKEPMKRAVKDKQCDENYQGKGNHKPGWMLKADPALGKKVADRKRAARPPLSKPSAEWLAKQNRDELNELSKDTLTSYIKRASKGAQDFSDVPAERQAGVHMALKKKHGGARVPATESTNDQQESARRKVELLQMTESLALRIENIANKLK